MAHQNSVMCASLQREKTQTQHRLPNIILLSLTFTQDLEYQFQTSTDSAHKIEEGKDLTKPMVGPVVRHTYHYGGDIGFEHMMSSHYLHLSLW